MWGAHAMGVFWGELVMRNFSRKNKYKTVAGISEKNAVFYYHKSVGTAFYNSVPEMDVSGAIGRERFSNQKELKKYIENSKEAIGKSDALYFDVLKEDLDKKNARALFNLLEAQADCFNEIYSYYHACQPQYFSEIEKDIKLYLAKKGLSREANYYIGLLSSQEELDVIAKEEVEWLTIARMMQEKKLDRASLVEASEMENKLKRHIDKYMSLGSGEGGRPWDKKYYWGIFEKIDFDINKKISDINERKKVLMQEKEAFIREKEISNEVVELANAVGKLGMLRLEIRLSWMRFSHTITNTLLALGKEISLDNILEIRMDEIRNIIENNDHAVTEEEIKRRQEAFLFLVENEEEKLFIGNEAISLKEKLVPSEISDTLEIKGFVACKGMVRGKVFMIDWNNKNLTEAMRNMAEGAILIAGQTRPQLMPVIKKAAAIVTDEGGIMCHAAIVSRELNIPCIIGTKIATQVLKDGDLVEVDANEGIVRIIKN